MRHRYLSLLAVASLALAGCVGCGADTAFRSNLPRYRRVIRRVQDGGIKNDQEKGAQVPPESDRLPSSAQLPPDLREASLGGEIYVYRPSTNQILVVFKTWRGKGRNMEGYLYAARPISATELSKDYYGDSVVVIDHLELVLGKQPDPNWYRVSYKLD